MANRMVTDNFPAYKKMLEFRKSRKDFVGDDDMGVFYRTQKLVSMIHSGEAMEKDIDMLMNTEEMSKDMVPMDWYHLECYPHPQEIHDELLMYNLSTAQKKRNQRGKVTKQRLKLMMYDTLLRRVDRYLNPDKYMNNKILCIVGSSGLARPLLHCICKTNLGQM